MAGIKCFIAFKVPRSALILLRIWRDPSSRVGRSRYTEPTSLIYRGIHAFLFPMGCFECCIVVFLGKHVGYICRRLRMCILYGLYESFRSRVY